MSIIKARLKKLFNVRQKDEKKSSYHVMWNLINLINFQDYYYYR